MFAITFRTTHMRNRNSNLQCKLTLKACSHVAFFCLRLRFINWIVACDLVKVSTWCDGSGCDL